MSPLKLNVNFIFRSSFFYICKLFLTYSYSLFSCVDYIRDPNIKLQKSLKKNKSIPFFMIYFRFNYLDNYNNSGATNDANPLLNIISLSPQRILENNISPFLLSNINSATGELSLKPLYPFSSVIGLTTLSIFGLQKPIVISKSVEAKEQWTLL